MIFAITKYSPLDIDSLLSSYSRTLDSNVESDFLYLFNYASKENKAKITIVFNSHEYCTKRDLKILDDNNENIIDVTNILKNSLQDKFQN